MNTGSLNLINYISYFKNVDSDKIGFIFSFFLHLIFFILILGVPNFFQTSPINIPHVIPIEIINVSDTTSILEKSDSDIKKEIKTEQPKKIEIKQPQKIKTKQNQKIKIEQPKELKFNSVESRSIENINIKTKPEKIIEEKKNIEDKNKIQKNSKDLVTIKEDILQKIDNEIIESLPLKKVKPRIKPKPKTIDTTTNKSDISIKIKQKPKPSFDIASMLKDLRNEKKPLQNPAENQEKKINNKKDESANNSSVVLSISEIDLLIQQLSSCWTAPAGAVIKKGMIVKVSAKVKTNRFVLYDTVRIVDTNIPQSNPFYGPITESAMRTLLNPDCNPLKLPTDKYDLWKNLTITFDHSIMKGYQ